MATPTPTETVEVCAVCETDDGRQVSEVRFPDGRVEKWCTSCWNRSVEERHAERKAELAALPRCEVESCNRRGTYEVGTDKVLLCGVHKNRAVANGPRAPFWAGPIQSGREIVLAAATRPKATRERSAR